MSNKRPKTDGRFVQLTLPLEEIKSRRYRAGSFRRHDHVSEALKDALKGCGLSREIVADEMSRLTGDQISVNHLNNWTAESKNGWRMPLEYAAALTAVTGDVGVVKAALEGPGCTSWITKRRLFMSWAGSRLRIWNGRNARRKCWRG